MAPILTYILGSVFLVSLVAFVGLFALRLSDKTLSKILFGLISFAAGSLFAAAFLDLLPEALNSSAAKYAFPLTLLGIIIFFVLEKFLYWYHCHDGRCEIRHHGKKIVQPVVYLNLVGDGIHNFLDGMIIAGSYLVSIPLGVVTTLAVFLHELPQEIGDFGVLIYGGLTRSKALFYNFLSALTAVFGALLAYYFSSVVTGFAELLVPFAAGGFIYIAGSDLLPELHHETSFKKASLQSFFFLLGVGIIWLAVTYFTV